MTMTFFTELEQTIQKIMWNCKRPRISNAILRGKKKKTSTRHNSPRLQTVLQSYINQDSVVVVPNRNTDQRNRIENLEINPDIYD